MLKPSRKPIRPTHDTDHSILASAKRRTGLKLSAILAGDLRHTCIISRSAMAAKAGDVAYAMADADHYHATAHAMMSPAAAWDVDDARNAAYAVAYAKEPRKNNLSKLALSDPRSSCILAACETRPRWNGFVRSSSPWPR